MCEINRSFIWLINFQGSSNSEKREVGINPIELGVQSLSKKTAHKPCLNCVRSSSRWDAHHHQWASFALKWLGFYLITSSVITLWDNVLDMHEKCGVETLFV